MPFHIQREKLVLEIALIQRLHHMHNDNTGVERTLDLKFTVSTRIQYWPERVSYMEMHAKVLTTQTILFG